ncbi:MAG: 16S rRNA (cytosine(1402)-N(4))-methyltransferase RsmH [Pseudomonadota bacterium]
MPEVHQPVLVEETMALLNCRPGGIYVDGTISEGGHAFHIFRTCPDIRLLIGIDRDDDVLVCAHNKLASFKDKFFLIKGNYADIKRIISDLQIKMVDGVLLDLGVSSRQLLSPSRGFSFSMDGPLDMRMDKTQKMTAGDLVNNLTAKELERIIREDGEEKWASSIVKLIVKKRKLAPITTTLELRNLIEKAIPFRARPRKIHPATRTFQALRIAVNDELGHLERALPDIIDVLAPGGRIAVISFHSLEDRIVKNTFRQYSRACTCPPAFLQCRCDQVQKLSILTKKPIVPKPEEILQNPRSRSARLRGGEKLTC